MGQQEIADLEKRFANGEKITLSNDEINEIFGCAKMGGIRKSNVNNCVVLISNYNYGSYHNQWEGEILHFAGAGSKGDQELNSLTRHIVESNKKDTPLYLFESFEKKEYSFRGHVKYLETYTKERQLDENKNDREVLLFSLTPVKYAPTQESIYELENMQETQITEKSTAELLSNLEKKEKSRNGTKKETTVALYDRNPAIKVLVKRRADGNCELCEERAPFSKKDGTPYLEVHHIVWLAKDGEDTIDNAVALCPNCHRKMHSLNDPADIDKLQNIDKTIPEIHNS